MTTKGRHPHQALSATKVRTLKESGRYADGNGLYLVVDESGAKRWLLRIVVRGKRRDIGLGGLRTRSLAEARVKAAEYRQVARDGGDPIAKRQKQRGIPTFEKAARKVHAQHTPTWRNSRHSAQWINTLETYIFPVFGNQRVDLIETANVLKALSSIWLAKPETARRVRQRIGLVLDWATAAGFRSGENPIRSASLGLPKQPDNKKHHAALPYPCPAPL